VHSGAFSYTNSKVLFAIKCSERFRKKQKQKKTNCLLLKTKIVSNQCVYTARMIAAKIEDSKQYIG